MNRVALVTGGGGFIGSHLVDRLLADGYRVRVLDNFATGSRSNISHVRDDIELIEGDVQSYERCHTAVRGCNLVFHQAALPSVPRSVADPLTSSATNVTGTLNILLAARDEDVERVVYASSSSVYGTNHELPKREEMAPQPISPYAVAKLAGEGYCRAFSEVYGLQTVSLRYFNVFGPRQDPLSEYSAVIPRFITCFLSGSRPTVFGDGEQSRDFTPVENVVEANLLAARARGVAGEHLNVACGTRTSLNEMVAQLRSLTGVDLEAIYEEPRPGEIVHSMADIDKARRLLGFEPTMSFSEGLAGVVEHYTRLRGERAPA